MRLLCNCLVIAGLLLTTVPSAAQSSPPGGRPENRWRYRFFHGHWWYWTPDNQWSFFNGRRWAPYRPAGEYQTRKVDPALLRLEAKEGVAGPQHWPRVGGIWAGTGGGWPISGTQGSIGGAPSGSFTTSPGPRTGVNTGTGASAGLAPTAGGASARSGAPSGMGGTGRGR